MSTISECIMFIEFTVLTVIAMETLRESGLVKNWNVGRPDKTFEEGHVCICVA